MILQLFPMHLTNSRKEDYIVLIRAKNPPTYPTYWQVYQTDFIEMVCWNCMGTFHFSQILENKNACIIQSSFDTHPDIQWLPATTLSISDNKVTGFIRSISVNWRRDIQWDSHKVTFLPDILCRVPGLILTRYTVLQVDLAAYKSTSGWIKINLMK